MATSTTTAISQISAQQRQTTNATTNTASTSTQTLNANFNTFLTLLTTQLRNQSPLEPMNTEQFTQQLTQFSQVEQQMRTNDTLDRLLTAQTTNVASAAIGMLGSDVVARGTNADLRGGNANWTLTSPSAASATITIKNAAGQVVRTEQRALNSGETTYNWNGRNNDGVIQPEGTYTISIEATNATNQAVTVTPSARGRVTSVDFSGSEPVLTVGNRRVPLSSVTSVSLAQ
jgi:flagellar basal-body rod modification protein FlgD